MNDWKASETKPGYRTKTIQYGSCTIVINRPILESEEQKRREQLVRKGVERALRDHLIRKENRT